MGCPAGICSMMWRREQPCYAKFKPRGESSKPHVIKRTGKKALVEKTGNPSPFQKPLLERFVGGIRVFPSTILRSGDEKCFQKTECDCFAVFFFKQRKRASANLIEYSAMAVNWEKRREGDEALVAVLRGLSSPLWSLREQL